MRLIVGVNVPLVGREVEPLRAAQRVSNPAKRPIVRVELHERLEPVGAALAVIIEELEVKRSILVDLDLEVLDDEVVHVSVEPFELDGEALDRTHTEAERVLRRALFGQRLRPEVWIREQGLRRLCVEPDATLEPELLVEEVLT